MCIPDILQQCLDHCSPDYLFYHIAKLEKYYDPEDFSIKAAKLLEVKEVSVE